MKTKQLYEAPQAESILLNLGRPILDGSQVGKGADVTFSDEESFEDYF